MTNLQKEDWYDGTAQGKAAISLGIQNKQSGVENYDWTSQDSADFDWPDFDEEEVGKMSPWLIYQLNADGTMGGWQDLNSIPDGDDRKMCAILHALSFPSSLEGSAEAAEELLDNIKEADDMEAEAAKHGFKSNDIFSVEDHMEAAEWQIDNLKDTAWADAQDLIDSQMEQLDKTMSANIDAAQEGGLLDPVHGVTLEDWAAANVKLTQAMPENEILSILGIEKPQWDEVNAEWNGRMSRDTTFAISKVYGDAFQNPNIGRFGGSTEAASTNDGAPCTFEEYVQIQVHMDKGSQQGIDAQAILAEHGKSLTDWSAIGAYWTVEFTSNVGKYFEQDKKFREKYEKEYSGGTLADDIDF